MSTSLTPELERLVEERIASGHYASSCEVLREALYLLQQRDELRRATLEGLRREIATGLEASARGEVVPAEQVFRELRQRDTVLAGEAE